jgi:hypothetical protein
MTAAKFWAALGAACTTAGLVLADGFSQLDAFAIAAAFLGAIGVYLVPNTPQED